MKKFLFLLSVWHIFVSPTHQYTMPEQIIDGYDVEYPVHEEAEFEKSQQNRLLLEPDSRAKRLVKYEVLESPGLHFKPIIQDDEVLKTAPIRRRTRRSAGGRSELHSDEIEDVDTVTRRHSNSDDVSVEDMPLAEKQRMNPAYYRSDDSRLLDKWVKAPYGDFQSRSQKEEEDAQSDASSNIGIKARTPRVNFITQQSQSSNSKDEPDGPEARERERERERERDRDRDSNRDRDRDQSSSSKPQAADDGYRKPERYYPSSYPSKTYDPYAPNFIPPYERDYYGRDPYYPRDPYREAYLPSAYYPYRPLAYNERPPAGMSRMTPPLGPSSSFYYRHQYSDYDDYIPRSIPNYYYSDKRFDLPRPGLPLEAREQYERELYRPYLYTNDVNSRPGRIIYYANLPEIVRTPANYRSATSRYGDPMQNDYYYNSNSYDDYRGLRTAKAATLREPPLASTTMRISSAPVRADTARERSYFG